MKVTKCQFVDEVLKDKHVIFYSVSCRCAQSGMYVNHRYFEHSNQRALTSILEVVLENYRNILHPKLGIMLVFE